MAAADQGAAWQAEQVRVAELTCPFLEAPDSPMPVARGTKDAALACAAPPELEVLGTPTRRCSAKRKACEGEPGRLVCASPGAPEPETPGGPLQLAQQLCSCTPCVQAMAAVCSAARSAACLQQQEQRLASLRRHAARPGQQHAAQRLLRTLLAAQERRWDAKSYTLNPEHLRRHRL